MSVKFVKNGQDLDVYVNDELFVDYRYEYSDGDTYQMVVSDLGSNECMNELLDLRTSEYPEGLKIIGEYRTAHLKEFDWLTIYKENGVLTADCTICISYKKWDNPFTLEEFSEVYIDALRKYATDVDITTYEEELAFSIVPTVKIESSSSVIGEIESFSEHAANEYDLVIFQLATSKSQNLLTKIFRFPDGYEAICSQYILWFGEFMAGLGVDANVSAENFGGKTYISVGLNEGRVDLKSLEKALYAYLSLPYSDFSQTNESMENIEAKLAFQSINSQISFFKQQIELKRSVIEFKSLTIDSLVKENEKLQTDNLLLKSMQDSNISLFDGALSISEYTIGPFKINPKNLLKWAKKSV